MDEIVKKQIEDLGNNWEAFKKQNDERLAQIEKKGAADAVTVEQVNKLNGLLDATQKRVEEVAKVAARPHLEAKAADTNAPLVAEYKKAFSSYLKKGNENGLEDLQAKALSSGSEVDGGFLVTPEMGGVITGQIFETSPMRQLASVITINSDSYELVNDYDSATASWTDGESAVSDSNTPQIGKIIIPVHSLVAQPKATQRLVDDASVDIEAWLSGKVSEIFSRTENTAFVSGNGNGKPKGFLAYTKGANGTFGNDTIQFVTSGSAAVITADGLIKLVYSLKDAYATNAKFLMKRATVQAARLLKDTTNQYLWSPGLAAGQPDSLLGYAVAYAEDMPVEGAGAFPVAFGNFKVGYQIVDRTGVRVLRDPYTEKPFIKFYTTKRVGGGLINFEAIKLLKCST